MPRFRPTARLPVLDPADRVLLSSAVGRLGQVLLTPAAGCTATGDRIVPYGQSDLVDRLVSDGVPTTPVRLPWRLGT